MEISLYFSLLILDRDNTYYTVEP